MHTQRKDESGIFRVTNLDIPFLRSSPFPLYPLVNERCFFRFSSKSYDYNQNTKTRSFAYTWVRLTKPGNNLRERSNMYDVNAKLVLRALV